MTDPSSTSEPSSARSDGLPEFARVLMVGAHPDDPEFACGATMAAFARRGASVSYVICTNGVQGGEDPDQPDQELLEARMREQRSAAEVLGVEEVVFLEFADGSLTPSLALRLAITRQIRRLRPDLVVTHNPLRVLGIPIGVSHPDHLAVGEATMSAVYPDARNPRAFRELLGEGLAPHRVKEVWIPAWAGEASHFVDATELFPLKLEALLKHASQVQGRPNFNLKDFTQRVGEWMGKVGEMAGYRYAEGFHRIDVG